MSNDLTIDGHTRVDEWTDYDCPRTGCGGRVKRISHDHEPMYVCKGCGTPWNSDTVEIQDHVA